MKLLSTITEFNAWFNSRTVCHNEFSEWVDAETGEQYQGKHTKSIKKIELIGTEKQIKWAEQIRLNILNNLDSPEAEVNKYYSQGPLSAVSSIG